MLGSEPDHLTPSVELLLLGLDRLGEGVHGGGSGVREAVPERFACTRPGVRRSFAGASLPVKVSRPTVSVRLGLSRWSG